MAFWRKLFKKKEKKAVVAKEEKAARKKVGIKPTEKKEVKVLKARPESKFAGKILLRPLITEKSALLGSEGKYSFQVAPKTNKTEIAKAIRDLYGEKPLSINIIRMRGKTVRYGRTQGKRKDWKKAIISFKPGVKLEVFEGV